MPSRITADARIARHSRFPLVGRELPSAFETGTRKPSFDNLLLLANALDVTTDYLLGRVDDFKQLAGADKLHRHYHALAEGDRRFADDLITLLAAKAANKTKEDK